MKRYRDEHGKLTKAIDEIAAETREEAAAYYVDGARYLYADREYVLHLRDDQTAKFDCRERLRNKAARG